MWADSSSRPYTVSGVSLLTACPSSTSPPARPSCGRARPAGRDSSRSRTRRSSRGAASLRPSRPAGPAAVAAQSLEGRRAHVRERREGEESRQAQPTLKRGDDRSPLHRAVASRGQERPDGQTDEDRGKKVSGLHGASRTVVCWPSSLPGSGYLHSHSDFGPRAGWSAPYFAHVAVAPGGWPASSRIFSQPSKRYRSPRCWAFWL